MDVQALAPDDLPTKGSAHVADVFSYPPLCRGEVLSLVLETEIALLSHLPLLQLLQQLVE